MFERNATYHRRTDLHGRFGGNAQSGIAPCAEHPYVFLFTAPAGEQYGYQDSWLSTTEFSYTGEGQVGDMEMARGNRAIQRHPLTAGSYTFSRKPIGAAIIVISDDSGTSTTNCVGATT